MGATYTDHNDVLQAHIGVVLPLSSITLRAFQTLRCDAPRNVAEATLCNSAPRCTMLKQTTLTVSRHGIYPKTIPEVPPP